MKDCFLPPSISQNKSALWSVPDEKKVKLKRAHYGTASRRFLPGVCRGELGMTAWHIKRHCIEKSTNASETLLLAPSGG